ncbi:formate/nitrite transporter family protein, putative [Entamoeba histolytica HM-1:IMSS-B]|uniref:Formate-nitrite transporter n=6 Tax=Entamoeba histolytica TaxID=5759 RepID=FNT_ENTH1|nr:formate/nitrite transporter family protein, putative [Entamoeba histolytica HM-1:IMSS]EMD48844.1 formate/nitrite transporter family protein [Entamoeba histolytica KU27]EMH77771.1 formate/nitrite transporter family protein, putative [Entamoeba histolytica HM-1:IMSS-B]ENY64679.1 formate/nitrite transporter family protein, putative [Entamoeba histolytica HM-1:IMSS-A]GAT93188.1 formate nitrite transporter family protein putative [Entamoeba histolytica]EAL47918.1 formate/nitrite transporter fami|eukprot:XP_653304.1 formate/nitrite transporter family protein, putative [Entamoeba histolytica HM-1:IMSS]
MPREKPRADEIAIEMMSVCEDETEVEQDPRELYEEEMKEQQQIDCSKQQKEVVAIEELEKRNINKHFFSIQPNTQIPVISSNYIAPVDTSRLLVLIGKTKATYPIMKMFSLSVLAGMLLSVGGLLSITIGKGIPSSDIGIQKIVFGFFNSVGLNLVVLCGGELFTSNCAFLIPGFMEGAYSRWLFFKTHFVVYFGNLVGSIFVSTYFGKLLGSFESPMYLSAVKQIGETKVAMNWGRALLSGIGCNWLVCCAVYFSASAKDLLSKLVVISFLVLTFASLEFENCVGNMFLLSLSHMYGGNFTLGQWILNNLIPVSIGNFIGGTFLLGIPLWYVHVSNVYNIPFLDPLYQQSQAKTQ